nr:MAG TPA: Phospholamban [Caudoviricetes sp.]
MVGFRRNFQRLIRGFFTILYKCLMFILIL